MSGNVKVPNSKTDILWRRETSEEVLRPQNMRFCGGRLPLEKVPPENTPARIYSTSHRRPDPVGMVTPFFYGHACLHFTTLFFFVTFFGCYSKVLEAFR